VNLLAQHICDPAGTVCPGSADGYRLGHDVTLTQLRGIFRVGDQGLRRQVGVLRRVRFSGYQQKPGPQRLLRHLGKDVVFAILVSGTVRTGQSWRWTDITFCPAPSDNTGRHAGDAQECNVLPA